MTGQNKPIWRQKYRKFLLPLEYKVDYASRFVNEGDNNESIDGWSNRQVCQPCSTRAKAAWGYGALALVRNESKSVAARQQGADEIAIADVHDPASLRAAVSGVDRVFHINPAFAPRCLYHQSPQ